MEDMKMQVPKDFTRNLKNNLHNTVASCYLRLSSKQITLDELMPEVDTSVVTIDLCQPMELPATPCE